MEPNPCCFPQGELGPEGHWEGEDGVGPFSRLWLGGCHGKLSEAPQGVVSNPKPQAAAGSMKTGARPEALLPGGGEDKLRMLSKLEAKRAPEGQCIALGFQEAAVGKAQGHGSSNNESISLPGVCIFFEESLVVGDIRLLGQAFLKQLCGAFVNHRVRLVVAFSPGFWVCGVFFLAGLFHFVHFLAVFASGEEYVVLCRAADISGVEEGLILIPNNPAGADREANVFVREAGRSEGEGGAGEEACPIAMEVLG